MRPYMADIGWETVEGVLIRLLNLVGALTGGITTLAGRLPSPLGRRDLPVSIFSCRRAFPVSMQAMSP